MKPTIYQAKDICGVSPYFVLPREEDVSYFEQSGGAPEAPLIEWAYDLIGDGLFIDVGAHVGTYSIPYAMLGKRVWAFEANPRTYNLLAAGMALNGIVQGSTVHTFQLALGEDFKEDVVFEVPHEDGGGSSSVCHFDNPAYTFETYMSPLDDYIPDLPITFIKVDCEGGELDVLRGGRQLIEAHRPKILFEMWSTEKGQRTQQLLAWFDGIDYVVQPVTWVDSYIAQPK